MISRRAALNKKSGPGYQNLRPRMKKPKHDPKGENCLSILGGSKFTLTETLVLSALNMWKLEQPRHTSHDHLGNWRDQFLK